MIPRALVPVAGLLLATACPPGMATGTGPWDLKTLRRTPQAQTTGVEEVTELRPDGQRVEVRVATLLYEGEPYQGRPTRVFAYYARPKETAGQKLPGIVLVHGGGGTAFPQWARLWAARGYAALAMDLAGKGPNRAPIPDGGPDQGDDTKFRRLKEGIRNAWSYHAVASVIRGISLLRSFPEVNRDRLAITGISWGGYLTSIVMSLDDRLKAAVPVYGCGFLHENSVWVPILGSLPEDERRLWIETFDPSRYLSRCKIPVLWMNGTHDFAYPLDSYRKSYQAMPGPRTLCVTVRMPHSHEAGWARPEIAWFVDAVLRNRKQVTGSLARVSLPSVQDGQARLLYDSEQAVSRAELHWTADLGQPWQKRGWTTEPARVLDLHRIEADLPPRRPLVWFLTLTDTRGAVTSTEHLESP